MAALRAVRLVRLVRVLKLLKVTEALRASISTSVESLHGEAKTNHEKRTY